MKTCDRGHVLVLSARGWCGHGWRGAHGPRQGTLGRMINNGNKLVQCGQFNEKEESKGGGGSGPVGWGGRRGCAKFTLH